MSRAFKMIIACNVLFIVLVVLDITGLIRLMPFALAIGIYGLFFLLIAATIFVMIKSLRKA